MGLPNTCHLGILSGMTHEDAICRLGGITKLARALGHPSGVGLHWASRGIPARYWHQVEALAREAKIDGITAATLAANVPAQEAA